MLKTALMAAVLTVAFIPARALADDTGNDGPCVEVEIAGVKTPSLKCLNQRLQQQVDRIHPPLNIAPLDATSPAVKLGGFNETGMSQQYGQNWGKSVYPYRPAQTYVNPLKTRP